MSRLKFPLKEGLRDPADERIVWERVADLQKALLKNPKHGFLLGERQYYSHKLKGFRCTNRSTAWPLQLR